MKNQKTIAEWELETGIKVNNPKGFKLIFRKNSNIYSNKYSEKQFRFAINKSYITVKTEKGLEFLYGKSV